MLKTISVTTAPPMRTAVVIPITVTTGHQRVAEGVDPRDGATASRPLARAVRT